MADSATDTPIETLLAERARYEQWLARLDASGANAPQTVRTRIRADYQQRLDRVIQELRTHGATIAADLDRHRGELNQLESERDSAQEALAEAELRHAVGEYGPEEWERIRGDSEGTIARLGERIAIALTEIARLDEVQRLIVAPAAAAPPAPVPAAAVQTPPPPAAAPAPAPMVAEHGTAGGTMHSVGAPGSDTLEFLSEPFSSPDNEPEPAPPPAAAPAPAPPPQSAGAPRFTPRAAPRAPAAPRPPAARAEPAPVDELAFLKSVTGEEERRGSSSRRSNESMARPAEALGTIEPAAADATRVEPPAPPPAPAPPSTSAAGSSTGNAKTLKCGECGTLNRPTEWYCERCGAELAAL
jgi:hypothetical protein